MTRVEPESNDPSVGDALGVLQERIREHYPGATFAVTDGDDPVGTYLWTTVDSEEPDAVLEVISDFLLDLQVNRGIPVYVIPVRTPERVRVTLERSAESLERPSDFLSDVPR